MAEDRLSTACSDHNLWLQYTSHPLTTNKLSSLTSCHSADDQIPKHMGIEEQTRLVKSTSTCQIRLASGSCVHTVQGVPIWDSQGKRGKTLLRCKRKKFIGAVTSV